MSDSRAREALSRIEALSYRGDQAFRRLLIALIDGDLITLRTIEFLEANQQMCPIVVFSPQGAKPKARNIFVNQNMKFKTQYC
jgi:hypothetical protein